MIMPMGFDQIDNAHRVWSLGVGDSVFPKRFEGDRLAMTLRNLIANPNTARACKQLAEKIAQGDSLELACDVIESS